MPARTRTEVEVAIGMTEWLPHAPSRVWLASFAMSWQDARRVRQEVEELIAANPEVPYTIRESCGHTSWGADSEEHLRIVLLFAEMVANGLIAAATFKLFERIAAWQRSSDERPNSWHAPLQREDAIEYAKWVVAVQYKHTAAGTISPLPSNAEELALVSDRLDSDEDTWTITLRDDSQAIYRVAIGRVAGIPLTSFVERIVIDPAQR